ncbi:MAG: MmgE/PrpD family protein [Chloroflexi bacterium]|nr:MmgE/PrpD family protein [Chloroflexota bacterium]
MAIDGSDLPQAREGETAVVAHYATKVRYEDLPPDVVVKAKQHILDSLGAILVGTRLEAGQRIVDFVRQHPGVPEATVLGTSIKTSSLTASLANGVLGHADESDDTHLTAIVHSGATVVPAALSVAERLGSNGRDFINSVVLGYDINCRVGQALDASLLRKNNHSPLGIPGCFGAAAAAGRLLALDEEKMCSAFGLAGQQASGIYAWLTEPLHMAKAFETGVAARNGVTAAFLAQSGFKGPPAVFEGQHNIFDAFSSSNNFAALTRELGVHFEIADTVFVKYPVGGPLQNPLDGLLSIMREHGLRAEDIDKVTVSIAPHWAWLVSNRPIQDISIELILAAAACYGRLGWEEAHSEKTLKDANVQKFKAKVKLVADPDMEKTYVQTRAARVEVVARDGRRYKISLEHPHGSPRNPFSHAQVEEKFLDLASSVLGKKKSREVVGLVHRLDDVPDIRALGDLLRT